MNTNNKERVLKHINLYDKDMESISLIKKTYGLTADSEAIRMALRNFKGVATND